MFWNKKERAKGLPDLPPIGAPLSSISGEEHVEQLPGAESHGSPETHEEDHSLPAFPDSPIQQGFSQSAIKDAVTHDEIFDDSFLPSSSVQEPMNKSASFPNAPSTPFESAKYKTLEMDNGPSWASSFSAPPVAPPPASPMPQFERVSRYQRDEESQAQDIFVRLDRFYAARKALETTKEKLAEIDEMLRKIRETKMREEQELSAWEKQLADVKIRVQDVVQNIFEKIE